MAIAVKMPKTGINMTEGVLMEIFCEEGDSVCKGDKLFEIETDKTTMPVEAREDGTVLKILAEIDEVYPCGTVLAVIGQPGEDFTELIG